MNILFVCSANISRSFLAEMLFKNEIRRLKLKNISTLSAGLFAYLGQPPDSKMVHFLAEKGISSEKHESRKITKDHVDWADLILVMERDHAKTIESVWPGVKDRIELLGKFTSEGAIPDDVVDPFGKSPYHYRLAQAQITMAIGGLVKSLNLNVQN